LTRDVIRNGNEGIGKPEPLKMTPRVTGLDASLTNIGSREHAGIDRSLATQLGTAQLSDKRHYVILALGRNPTPTSLRTEPRTKPD
jgi:hypothetical protein